MALPRTPEQYQLMVELAREAIAHPAAPYSNEFFEMLMRRQPWPHMVSYRADAPRGARTHIYCDPDTFLFIKGKEGPSDSLWIVPGTLERQL